MKISSRQSYKLTSHSRQLFQLLTPTSKHFEIPAVSAKSDFVMSGIIHAPKQQELENLVFMGVFLDQLRTISFNRQTNSNQHGQDFLRELQKVTALSLNFQIFLKGLGNKLLFLRKNKDLFLTGEGASANTLIIIFVLVEGGV